MVIKPSTEPLDLTVSPAALASALASASDEIREQFRPPANTLFLHARQMEVYNNRCRFKVVVAGRRWGKTQLAKISLIKYARKPRRLIWYVAPSYRMAKQIMWPDLVESIPRSWVKKYNETILTITLVNGSRIELKGADNPDTLRGVGIHYLVMDEVQDIQPDAWRKVLRPTLASTGGHALFIGTPKAYNVLYDLWKTGQKESAKAWASWQFPTITSPFIPAEEIEAARDDMDEKAFKQEFEACHLPDTKVLMWGGKKKEIQFISKGDYVIHLREDGAVYPCRVLQSGMTGVKQVVDVVLETGEVISASSHHKFKVYK